MAAHAYPGITSAKHPVKPAPGMTLAFKTSVSSDLAGIPAHVVYVWPRFRSGNYLVTLEYPRPVKLGKEFITGIDAFASELEVAIEQNV